MIYQVCHNMLSPLGSKRKNGRTWLELHVTVLVGRVKDGCSLGASWGLFLKLGSMP